MIWNPLYLGVESKYTVATGGARKMDGRKVEKKREIRRVKKVTKTNEDESGKEKYTRCCLSNCESELHKLFQ